MRHIDYAEHRFIDIGDAHYCYLEAGKGTLLILLHGYPDNAYSWEHQIRYFASQGYRVIAPFMRGYAPTQTADDAYFDRATIAQDIVQLIEAVRTDGPVYLVGQDWGAAISYGLLGAFPSLFQRAAILAVPHPVEIKRTLRQSPRHILRSFHWFLFQLPWLPELLIQGSGGAVLKGLWRLWSVDFSDHAHVDDIVKTQRSRRHVKNTLAYYRAALQPKFRDPALHELFERLDAPIQTPTKVLCGRQDMRLEMLPRQADMFTDSAQYQWEAVDNAGHFLHREQPDTINRLLAEWFQQH